MITPEKFIILLSKLEQTEFFGVLRILQVDNTYDDPIELLTAAVDKFMRLPRKPRRELWRIMRAAARGGKKNGPSTKN